MRKKREKQERKQDIKNREKKGKGPERNVAERRHEHYKVKDRR